jgi:hypothetical protein
VAATLDINIAGRCRESMKPLKILRFVNIIKKIFAKGPGIFRLAQPLQARPFSTLTWLTGAGK